jgi:hypothetical protein
LIDEVGQARSGNKIVKSNMDDLYTLRNGGVTGDLIERFKYGCDGNGFENKSRSCLGELCAVKGYRTFGRWRKWEEL